MRRDVANVAQWSPLDKMIPHNQVSGPNPVANVTSDASGLTTMKRCHKIVTFKKTEDDFSKKYIKHSEGKCACVSPEPNPQTEIC